MIDEPKPQHRNFYDSDFPDERLAYQGGWCFQRLGYPTRPRARPTSTPTLRYRYAYGVGFEDARRDEERRR